MAYPKSKDPVAKKIRGKKLVGKRKRMLKNILLDWAPRDREFPDYDDQYNVTDIVKMQKKIRNKKY